MTNDVRAAMSEAGSQEPIAPSSNETHFHERTESFIRLLGENHKRLYLYVMSLVPNRYDADDVFQQTNLVLWREFEQFQPGTNFAAWSCRVAFNQVLAWRERKQRDRLVFSEEFLQAVEQELSTDLARREQRSQILRGCIGKLPEHQRELIRLRYQDEQAVEAIAAGLGRTMDAVYRMLSRVRHTLHDCVSRTQLREGVS